MPIDLLGDMPNVDNSGQQVGGKDLLPDMQSTQDPTAPSNNSAFMAAVEGFNRSFGRIAEGALQIAAPVLPEKFNMGVAQQNLQQEQSFERAKQEFPVASRVGEAAGYISQGLVTPVAQGSLATKVSSMALTGGLLGGVQYGSPTERATNAAIGAGTGALAGYAMGKFFGPEAAVPANKRYESGMLRKLLDPEQAARNTVAQQVVDEGGLANVAARGAAARDIGVNLTPAQVLGSQAAAKAEGRIPITDATLRTQSVNYLKAEESKLQDAVKNIVKGFMPEGDDAARAAQIKAYDKLAPLQTSPASTKELFDNPIIADEMASLNNNKYATKAVRELADTSVLKLDKVKQEIDRSLYKDVALTTDPDRVMSAETRRALQEARSLIVNKLDSEFPEYTAARKLSEKIILKNDIQESLNKIAPKAGKLPNEISLDQMYNRLWGTPEKQDLFFKRLESAGGDPEYAQKVITVLNQFRESPIEKLAQKGDVEQTANLFGSLSYRMAAFTQKLAEGKYNQAYLNLITNQGKWEKAVDEVLNKPNATTAIQSFKHLLKQAGTKVNNMFEYVTNPKKGK